MDVKEIISLINSTGFSVFVAVWFMFRLEKRLESISKSLTKLIVVTKILAKVQDEDQEDQ